MVKRDEILSFLKERKEELFSEYQLVKIGLFGSFARNEGTEKSDIDLIIEFQPNTKNLSEKKSKIKDLVSKKFNREVDLYFIRLKLKLFEGILYRHFSLIIPHVPKGIIVIINKN